MILSIFHMWIYLLSVLSLVVVVMYCFSITILKILEIINLKGGKLLTQLSVSRPCGLCLCHPGASWWKCVVEELFTSKQLEGRDRAKRAGRAAVPVPPLSHTPNDNSFLYPHY